MPNKNKKKIIRRFIGNEGGAVAVMFALTLPVILGFVGLGIDAGMWFKERRNMQTATDAAAVSAALERTFGATNSAMLIVAKAEATRHGFIDGTDVMALNSPPLAGAFAGDTGYVEITIVHPLNTFLSQIISNIVPESNTRAVATTVGKNDACMISLAPSGTGINVQNASVSMDGCGVFANSDGTENPNESIKVSGDTLTADCIMSHGAIDGTVGTDIIVDAGCDVVGEVQTTMDDPFENLAVPNISGCQDANLDLAGGTLSNSGGSGNLTVATVICGNVSVNNNLVVEPGIYIIHGGNLTINGNASFTAPGVTLIVNDGKVTINGGATVNWSAPTVSNYSGVASTGNDNYIDKDYTNYTGIALYQSAAAGSGNTRDVGLNGGAAASISGAVYVPNNDISFGGNGEVTPSGCLQLVGQTVSFGGDAQIQNVCSMYGGNPVNYGVSPGLVE
ncbi:MAG: pilus assembly protein [Rhodospirillaceae bacterium]|nr:pilus assembly protein [Rhodospirillaceae bacterium]